MTRQLLPFAGFQVVWWVSNQQSPSQSVMQKHEGHRLLPLRTVTGSMPYSCMDHPCMLLQRRWPWVHKGALWNAEAGRVDTCPSKPSLPLRFFWAYLKFPFMSLAISPSSLPQVRLKGAGGPFPYWFVFLTFQIHTEKISKMALEKEQNKSTVLALI